MSAGPDGQTGFAAPARGSLEARAARVLFACASAMLPPFPQLPEPERARVLAEMEVFLGRQVFSMPRFLLLPFLLALLAFDLLPLATHGRRFGSLPAPARARILAAWSSSRLGPKRDLVKLVRSCALYFYLDHPRVRAQLEAGDGG